MTDFTQEDLQQIAAHGLTVDKVEQQIERFRTGFPFLRLAGACEAGRGITVLDDELRAACADRWAGFLADNGDVLKFVPASGAASRMFKALFEFANGDTDVPAEGSAVAQLIDNISRFAFYGELCQAVKKAYGEDVTPESLVAQGDARKMVRAVIGKEGLNYGALPKALLTFHAYPDEHATRTALEEQLAEGAQTAANAAGRVRLHFTVSTDHRKLFEEKIAAVLPAMEARYGVKYDITLSEQKPSTDTIALTPDNEPFRDDKGRIVFRPGGHGALIENLSDIDAEVVFIKNIDNVVADSHRATTIEYKKYIGGYLLLLSDRLEALRARIESGDDSAVDDAEAFLEGLFFTQVDTEKLDDAGRRAAILRLLDRPVRVCGMVRNEGEPGGGPYLAYSTDGTTIAPQILESTQIDVRNAENVEMMKKAGYFNPVDLVCRLRRKDGSRYNLADYVDHATGFISSKSSAGRELKALELPGLWNGAMSDWNTAFVEVPAATFNPVKTVNDLLRPAHQ